MPRGGKRVPKIDPETGQPKKIGRPKVARPTNGIVAGRVLEQQKSEQLWNTIVEIEKAKLGIGKDGKRDPAIKEPTSTATGPLARTLEYLEDRRHGRPTNNLNHMHDKPLEVNATLNLSERFRIAMEKGSKRVSDLR